MCELAVTKLNKLRSQYKSNVSNHIIKLDNTKAKKGEYFSINTLHWEEIPCHVINQNLIGVGRPFKENEARAFIQFKKGGEVEECETYLHFPTISWVDYRSPRGETKFQEARIKDTGVIYISGYDVLNARVFIPKED